jgi:hypothetical protein
MSEELKDNGLVVLCNNCKLVLDEDPHIQPDQRIPCPSCGSTSRNYQCVALVGLSLGLKVDMKAKHHGEREPFIEELSGNDLHRKTGKHMDKTRIIDRENDLYKEIITDPKSGKIIHQCIEPLSKHIGHGDAKNKKKTQ